MNILKGSDRYYAGIVEDEIIYTKAQAAAWRFDSERAARGCLQALYKLTNGREATDLRPMYLRGIRRVKSGGRAT